MGGAVRQSHFVLLEAKMPTVTGRPHNRGVGVGTGGHLSIVFSEIRTFELTVFTSSSFKLQKGRGGGGGGGGEEAYEVRYFDSLYFMELEVVGCLQDVLCSHLLYISCRNSSVANYCLLLFSPSCPPPPPFNLL